MAAEQYANLPTTLLNGAINNSVTSIVVDTGSVFPSVGDFALRCENEIMLCTARSGNTLTVQRGQEGTTAASHADNTAIYSPLTARSLQALPDKFMVVDAIANRPAAGLRGRIFQPTDHFIASYDDGTAWRNFGPSHYFGSKPNNADYSWVNQGSATVTDSPGDILLSSGTPAASQWQLRCRVKTRTVTGNGSKVTVAMQPMLWSSTFSMAGFGLRESSSGKIQFVRFTNDQDYLIVTVSEISNAAAGTQADLGSGNVVSRRGTNGLIVWVRIEEISGVLYFQYSANGIDFFNIYSGTLSPYFSGSPNQLVLLVVPYSQEASARYFDVREQ